jgi:hypothetical protein
MKAWLLAVLCGLVLEAGEWTPWSPRAEIAPRAFVDTTRDRGEGGALAIAGSGNAAAFGGWRRTIAGVQAGAWYRFRAYYQAEGVPSPNWQVIARVDWEDAAGKRVSKPDYASAIAREGDKIGA